MHQPIQLTRTIPAFNISTSQSLCQRGFLLISLALVWLALSPASRAADGDFGNGNTVEGNGALTSLTTGFDNTAMGFDALFHNTAGSNNTANGFETLGGNTTGNNNTANGFEALLSNTTGSNNTANGFSALGSNTTGFQNTASGVSALFHNTTGSNNTANGLSALSSNTTGTSNTANGLSALSSNTTGFQNTASGADALFHNTIGSNNTANGVNALLNNTTGTSNIGLGGGAGSNLTTGNSNIDIGNVGIASESGKIRIGTKASQTATFIAGISGATVAGGVTVVGDTNGQLGTIVSSARFKEAVKPMDKASEAILALQPVIFRYKHELDPQSIPQFGLVAEQVEKVNPDLVARDDQGKAYTVRYEAINAMLLNEFLKEHRKVEEQARKGQEQEATMSELKSRVAQERKDFQTAIAQQQKEITTLTASIEEQNSQIRKVNAQLEMLKAAPPLVVNNQ